MLLVLPVVFIVRAVLQPPVLPLAITDVVAIQGEIRHVTVFVLKPFRDLLGTLFTDLEKSYVQSGDGRITQRGQSFFQIISMDLFPLLLFLNLKFRKGTAGAKVLLGGILKKRFGDRQSQMSLSFPCFFLTQNNPIWHLIRRVKLITLQSCKSFKSPRYDFLQCFNLGSQ